MTKRRPFTRTAWLAAGVMTSAALLFASKPAGAHFILQKPASWSSQNLLGDPQKLAPCGDDGGTATGIVTTFQSGQTITVTIEETIFHPGHYRIALAQYDRSELPEEPIVTVGSSPCGSTEIQNPPVFPVLADGVFLHTKPFDGPQTIQITLPPDITCEHCTLQILEFMSEHALNNPGGCFYHHCADLAILDSAAGAGGAAGTSATGTAGASAGMSGAAGTASAGGTAAGGAAGAASAGGAAGAASAGGAAGAASAGAPGGGAAAGMSAGGAASGGGQGGASAAGGASTAAGGASTAAGGAAAGGAAVGMAGTKSSSAGGMAAAGAEGAELDRSESDSGCSASTLPGPRHAGAAALVLSALGVLARRARTRRN